jgi:hypothetical protein
VILREPLILVVGRDGADRDAIASLTAHAAVGRPLIVFAAGELGDGPDRPAADGGQGDRAAVAPRVTSIRAAIDASDDPGERARLMRRPRGVDALPVTSAALANAAALTIRVLVG